MERLTKGQVVWAYRTLLGRSPEVAAIVDDWVAKRCSLDDLVSKIIASDEFKIRAVSRAVHDAKQRGWLRSNRNLLFKCVAAALAACLFGGATGAIATIFVIHTKPELLAGLF